MRFNGKDFADFGVHVDESKAFGSPEKDYELVEIMGRNGNLSIYNDRFKDITLPFPCFIRTGFIEKYRSLLAYLNSQTGYQRLETDKEPNHFRKALFQGIVDPQTTAFNHGGFFTINFTAHPQRFLKSGETPVSMSSSSTSSTGNPVTVSENSAVNSLSVALNPIQTGTGEPSPTNIRPITGHTSATVTRTGKNLFNGQFAYHNASSYSPVLDGETYTVSSKSTGVHQINMQYITNTNTYYGDSKIVSEGDTFGKTTVTIPTDVKGVLIYVNGDASNAQHTAYDTQIELGSTATEYEPYTSNTYTIDLNGTRYGGTVDLVTGVLTVTAANIASYNGETLPSTWISDRNVYANGTTPTTGAQVVYTLATPLTYNLTPQQISLLTGTNYISSDGNVTVTVTAPTTLENPTLFESKPLIRVYGNGLLAVNNQYITVASNPFPYIDIDCDMMDAFYNSNNANQYVSLPNDYITLKSGNNYVAYDGTVVITPRWYEV